MECDGDEQYNSQALQSCSGRHVARLWHTVDCTCEGFIRVVDPKDIARVRRHLEQHRHTYDRATLRRQLLTNGYDPRAVELAMADVYAHNAPQHRATLWKRRRLAVWFGVILINSLVIYPTVTYLIPYSAYGWRGLIDFWPIVLTLFSEAIVASKFRERNSEVSRSIAWAMYLSLVVWSPYLFGALAYVFMRE
jgi:hypothetical protein